VVSLGGKAERVVKLIIELHPVPRLRMSGDTYTLSHKPSHRTRGLTWKRYRHTNLLSRPKYVANSTTLA
jgi:hypothetical protein